MSTWAVSPEQFLSPPPPPDKSSDWSVSPEDFLGQSPKPAKPVVPGMEKLGGTPPGPPEAPVAKLTREAMTGHLAQSTPAAIQAVEEAEQPGKTEQAFQKTAKFAQQTGGGTPGQPTLGEIGQILVPPAAEVAGAAAAGVESAVGRQALKGLNLALNGYFAYQSGKGALEQTSEAYKAFKQGDYLGAIRNMTTAGLEGFFGWANTKAAAQQYQGIADIAKLRNTLQQELNARAAAERMAETGPPSITAPEEAAPAPAPGQPSPALPPAGAAETQPAAAPEPTPPASTEIIKGSKFDTPEGALTVLSKSKNQVLYSIQGPEGTKKTAVKKLPEFQAMVSPPPVTPPPPEAVPETAPALNPAPWDVSPEQFLSQPEAPVSPSAPAPEPEAKPVESVAAAPSPAPAPAEAAQAPGPVPAEVPAAAPAATEVAAPETKTEVPEISVHPAYVEAAKASRDARAEEHENQERDEYRVQRMLEDAQQIEANGNLPVAENYRRAAEAYQHPSERPLVERAWMDKFEQYDRQRPAAEVSPLATGPTPEEIQELRESLGVADKAKLDAHDPVAGVRKLGNKWLYRTVQGNDAPALYDTRREAVEAATFHKNLKTAQYEDPTGYADLSSVRARKALVLIKKYMDQGMSEMDAGAKARREMGESEPLAGILPAAAPASPAKQPWQMTRQQFRDAVRNGQADWPGRGTAQRTGADAARDLANAERSGTNVEIARKSFNSNADERHGGAVAMAVAEGKPVPPEVLAEYPNLKTKTPAAQPDANESLQDKSWREWRENAARVAANPKAASETDLRRAVGFLDHARRSAIRRAQEAGSSVDPNVLAGYDAEEEHYKALLKEKEDLAAEAARLRAENEKLKAAKAKPAPLAKNPAAALRATAEGMQSQIDAKRNPAIANQNPTARRARIAGGMAKEADSIEEVQNKLKALADAHDAGTVPETLKAVRSRSTVEELMHRERFPAPFVHQASIQDLAKMKGKPGTKAGLDLLLRRNNPSDGGARLHGLDEINAVTELVDRAEKAGVTTAKYVRDDLARSKRLYSAGLDPNNWEQARKDLNSLGKLRPAEKLVERQIREAERDLIGTKIEGYFPTPKPLAERLVEMADIKPGMSVLEPSAGSGAIADELKKAGGNVTAVEPVGKLRHILTLKGHALAEDMDFLEHQGQYDRIVMNPPFERGQDMDHVQHAYDLLKPGGRLVAIMSEGSFSRGDKKATAFREWLDEHDGENEKLPEKSFTGKDAQRQTGVATRTVVIDKPEKEEPSAIKKFATEESGTSNVIPRITELAEDLKQRFGENAPKANYSGLGAIQRSLLPGKNLAEVEQASKGVFEAALPTASADAITSTILQSAVPAIRKALEGSGRTWDQMRLYYTESRLQGLKQRWGDFADQATKMTEQQLEHSLDENPDGTPSAHIFLLSQIEGRQGLAQNLGQTAAAIAESGDWDLLRDFLADSYTQARDRVASVMSPEQFNEFHGEVASNPKLKEADRIYGDLIEKPMAQGHAINEGVFSDALGPANRYIPLIPTNKPPKPGPGRRLAYHKPKNASNAFATGLSNEYDIGMEPFAKKLSYANRSNYKAALIQKMRDTGWLQPDAKGFQTDKGLAMTGPDGEQYLATREEIQQPRTLIQNGKVVHLPAKFEVMPRFMNQGLKATLAREPMDPDQVIGAMRWANMLATKGPMELVFHSSGVLGSLYANTPFLGGSGLDKALSLPLMKWFGIRGKLMNIDPTTAENVAKLHEMAKAGAIPAKSGKVTYNKEYAESTGAKRERLSFSPLLYGPKGIDARARILMYDIFKAAYPNGTTSDLHHFVNQLANYTPEMQGRVESFLKSAGIGPFATAGMTRIVNSVHSFTGTGPGPGRTANAKAWWWATSSAYIALAAWAVAHHYLTGKWPTEDKRSQLMQFPVGNGNGYLDQYRHSKLGNALWGSGPEVGYLNFSFLDNPLALRGARAMGLADAYRAHQLGADSGQMMEAAQKGVTNSLAHPVLGPASRAIFVGVTGEEPYITGFRDRGNVALKFYPAIPPHVKPGLPRMAHQAWAAARQLNSFTVDATENLGSLTGFVPPSDAKRNWWIKTGADILAPGLVGTPSNPWKAANALRQERRVEAR